MAVRVFSNNLPDPNIRAKVQEVVLQAIGERSGDWMVQIHENQGSPSWHITIWGPNNFQWSQEFFGLEEQNGLDDYSFIKKAVTEAFSHARLTVYVSYAFPDNADGFVLQLCDLLAQELQVQTGEAAKVLWEMDRTRRGAAWTKETEQLIKRSAVLIPVMSPSYFKSEVCQKEFEIFFEREQWASRPPIVPVYFVTAGEVEQTVAPNPWIRNVGYQFVDFRQHRFDLKSMAARRAVATVATSVRDLELQLSSERKAHLRAGPRHVVTPPESVYIQSLRLENFRCFDRLELHFDRPSSLEGRWTCIAGINGAGKSTVLQALSVGLLGNPLATELGGERLNHLRRRRHAFSRERALVEVTLTSPSGQFSLRLEVDENRIVSTSGPPHAPALIAPSWERMRHLVIVGYGATRNLSARVDSSSEHLSSDVRHHITLFDPLSQLAGCEVLLERQTATWPFAGLFQKVTQQVFDTDLQIVLSSPQAGLRFTISDRDTVEAIDLPDGFRSATAWIADFCSLWCEKAPDLAANADPSDIHAIVLIDEIDLHLHPSLQRALIPRLRKVFPKVQWIVTTHSPLVLANFDVNEIVALDRDEEGNIRQLDRQILGFTSDQIYEWLMGTRPMGAAIEEEIRKSDEGVGKSRDEVARDMRISPGTDEEAAQKQVTEFKEILKTLKR